MSELGGSVYGLQLLTKDLFFNPYRENEWGNTSRTQTAVKN